MLWRTLNCTASKAVLIVKSQHTEPGIADARGILQDGLKYRLQITR